MNRLQRFLSLAAILLLGVSPSLHSQTTVVVDSVGDVGIHTSLAVVNGQPAISYFDWSHADLKYCRATDDLGATWGSPVTVDSAGDVGGYTALTVVNGRPAIAYSDFSNHDLRFVRAADANGQLWETPLVIDSYGYVGEYASMAIVAGNPAIAYFDGDQKDLKYARALDPDGATWNAPLVVESAGFVGGHTSMVVVAGNPAIVYFDWTNQDIRYVRALDAGGASWAEPISVATNAVVSVYCSLEVVDGNPAVVYVETYPDDCLRFVRALDATGASWDTPVSVAEEALSRTFVSLAVVSGRPAISYAIMITPDHDLRLVRATDASGTTWGPANSVEIPDDVGRFNSLAEVAGNPAISYYDTTNGDLKYAFWPAADIFRDNFESGDSRAWSFITD